MADQKSTGNGKGGGNGDDKPEPAPRACPVWVQGRCDGTTCSCATSGGN